MARPRALRPLILAKLGGSLITNKRQRETARLDLIRRLAHDVARVMDTDAPPNLVLGHGSGSFGHWEASRYNTRNGVHTRDAWLGFARVSAAAKRLNQIVTDTFIEAGVPVLSQQPSASALSRDREILTIAMDPLNLALEKGLVPLIYGDVAFDEALGGTILSTEDLFVHLAREMHPDWVLILGSAPGVLDSSGNVIPLITPDSYAEVKPYLGASVHTDVTGGMADKVCQMVALVQSVPTVRVRILGGAELGSLRNALHDPAGFRNGTLIRSADGEGLAPSLPSVGTPRTRGFA